MKKVICLVLSVMLFSIVFTGCGKSETPNEPTQNNTQGSENAGILSSFSTTDIDGNTIDQSVLKGKKLTMVNIWATFCGPCINEMPDLGELAAEYADKGVGIVGIPLDVTDEKGNIDSYLYNEAVDIVATTKAAYTHIVPVESMFVRKLASVTAVPETIFVDSQGNQVGDCYYGARSKAQWTEIIEELLGEVQ